MFVDIAKINIKAGKGGNGAVAFHREKYVAPAVPTAATAAEAETSYAASTPIFLPSPTSDTRKNTAQKTVPTAAAHAATEKKVMTLLLTCRRAPS